MQEVLFPVSSLPPRSNLVSIFIIPHFPLIWPSSCSFITMRGIHGQEREKGAWPYRVLARAAGESRSAEGVVSRDDEEHEERFVVLKREPNHFVLLKALPVVGEGTAETRNGGGKSGGTVPLSKRGRACFRRSDLPDVVRTLWNIEPKARVT